MSTLSENMKNMRILRGFTMREISDQLGVSSNSLANWEKGKISPPVDYVMDLCKIYKIGADEMFGWKPCKELEDFVNSKKEILLEMQKLQEEKAAIDLKLKEYAEKLNQRN